MHVFEAKDPWSKSADIRLLPAFLRLQSKNLLLLLLPPLYHLFDLAGPGMEDLRQYLFGRLQL
jgi:hypothetical protein